MVSLYYGFVTHVFGLDEKTPRYWLFSWCTAVREHVRDSCQWQTFDDSILQHLVLGNNVMFNSFSRWEILYWYVNFFFVCRNWYCSCRNFVPQAVRVVDRVQLACILSRYDMFCRGLRRMGTVAAFKWATLTWTASAYGDENHVAIYRLSLAAINWRRSVSSMLPALCFPIRRFNSRPHLQNEIRVTASKYYMEFPDTVSAIMGFAARIFNLVAGASWLVRGWAFVCV